jgi:hypothetical protein
MRHGFYFFPEPDFLLLHCHFLHAKSAMLETGASSLTKLPQASRLWPAITIQKKSN